MILQIIVLKLLEMRILWNRNLLKSIKLLGASDNKLKELEIREVYEKEKKKKLQSRLKWNSHWLTNIFIETKWIKKKP